MPSNYSTGTTIKASSFGLFATINTGSWPSFWKEVFIVNFAMTINAIRNAIVNIKPQFGILGKWFYVVGMKLFFVPTFLASIVVSFKNCFTPFLQLIRKASSFTKHRLTVFKGIATSPPTSTRTRTKSLNSYISLKGLLAEFTDFIIWRISIIPTFFTAVFRVFRPIRKGPIFLSTNNTTFLNHLINYNKNYIASQPTTNYCEDTPEEEIRATRENG